MPSMTPCKPGRFELAGTLKERSRGALPKTAFRLLACSLLALSVPGSTVAQTLQETVEFIEDRCVGVISGDRRSLGLSFKESNSGAASLVGISTTGDHRSAWYISMIFVSDLSEMQAAVIPVNHPGGSEGVLLTCQENSPCVRAAHFSGVDANQAIDAISEFPLGRSFDGFQPWVDAVGSFFHFPLDVTEAVPHAEFTCRQRDRVIRAFEHLLSLQESDLF